MRPHPFAPRRATRQLLLVLLALLLTLQGATTAALAIAGVATLRRAGRRRPRRDGRARGVAADEWQPRAHRATALRGLTVAFPGCTRAT
ncbi:MAG TPA: hypothetical protein VF169_26770 [Albitalea sp.]|uniref:hypothetical protein n=1 Tax=Piscinibacter sp. TaxID=1903157 RepID=UPI002ED6A924